ncbi:MAG: DUF1289 domain-containing protein [Bacteroidales bacterium]|jgi:predicted Fe-S protein YdhL (DUF1289 family)|nr:DUF1289 domain-containing protein [Bacteroidales bacterium]NCU35626.1 DUF1289 domain-containing protein [Candidatus Falkowbacteria bacterium]MDD2632743.1 DUF1289 domain-containing protein [Bacteroidales bacterium]MDD3130743.1 DUF1289 domain-containing protein [Bacteroidales bacterium]MDD3526745.1 DUF1289 domain-containing protein [Bacteroidales bacterium]
MTQKIENPCLSICRYDDETVCIGCRRTKQEATTWWRMTEEEKQQVMENIKTRQKQAGSNYDHYV